MQTQRTARNGATGLRRHRPLHALRRRPQPPAEPIGDTSELDLRRRQAVDRLVAFGLGIDEIATATELPRGAVVKALRSLARTDERAAAALEAI